MRSRSGEEHERGAIAHFVARAIQQCGGAIQIAGIESDARRRSQRSREPSGEAMRSRSRDGFVDRGARRFDVAEKQRMVRKTFFDRAGKIKTMRCDCAIVSQSKVLVCALRFTRPRQNDRYGEIVCFVGLDDGIEVRGRAGRIAASDQFGECGRGYAAIVTGKRVYEGAGPMQPFALARRLGGRGIEQRARSSEPAL